VNYKRVGTHGAIVPRPAKRADSGPVGGFAP
jgi:hypothetical protein